LPKNPVAGVNGVDKGWWESGYRLIFAIKGLGWGGILIFVVFQDGIIFKIHIIGCQELCLFPRLGNFPTKYGLVDLMLKN
jgi:hypothetical protein